VAAADFGVMDFSGVRGYTVGFSLVDAQASDATSVVVKLYKDTTVLGTITTNQLLTNYPTATSLSGPFDVLGTFDYAADGNWTYSGWDSHVSIIPNKAEITVTFRNGLVKTAINELLTGDTSIFVKQTVIRNIHIESNNAKPTKAVKGDTITLTFTTDEPVTKLATFKINGMDPDTFTNEGNVYTITHLVSSGVVVTGNPVTFQINVMNGGGISSQSIKTTTDGSSVTIVNHFKVFVPNVVHH
jgi:hypothetical protein